MSKFEVDTSPGQYEHLSAFHHWADIVENGAVTDVRYLGSTLVFSSRPEVVEYLAECLRAFDKGEMPQPRMVVRRSNAS